MGVPLRWLVTFELQVELDDAQDPADALKKALGRVNITHDQIATSRVSEIRPVMRSARIAT